MPTRKENILVILNPSSGVVSKDVATSIIFNKLRHHFQTVSLINSNSPSHAREIIRQGREHFDIITAFGGDGTINSIARELVGTEKVLGILPGGSGNGLSRNLGIPLSWRRALDVLIKGRDVFIDCGKINRHLFFNVAGIGLDGFISKKFNLESKSRGIMPYIYFALKGYFEMPVFKVKVLFENIEVTHEIMLIAFANFQQYGGKAIIAPFADPYDHLLDFCQLSKFSILKSSLNLQRLFTGNIDKFPFYKTFKFDQVSIEALEGPIPFHFDGEYGADLTSFTVQTIPSGLKVRIPK